MAAIGRCPSSRGAISGKGPWEIAQRLPGGGDRLLFSKHCFFTLNELHAEVRIITRLLPFSNHVFGAGVFETELC